MKTFWQLIEAINIPKHDDSVSLRQLLHNIPHRLQVQFALEVAEDAFHLNNDNTRATAAQQCIDLVKAWLQDPKQVTTAQLETAANVVWNVVNNIDDAQAIRAASTAASAADAAYTIAYTAADSAASYVAAYTAADHAADAAFAAAWAHAYAADANNPDENIRAAKLRQYRNLAIHMQPTKSDKPHYFDYNLKKLVQIALQTRDSSMFPIVWDAALDVDLLSDDIQKNYKYYEEHPFTFYHMLNQVIETK